MTRKLCRAHYLDVWRTETKRPIPHGTIYGAIDRRCRCKACLDARSAYDRVRNEGRTR